jgi:hypothetical protein
MKQMTSKEELPVNMTEEESAVFWVTHSVSEELLAATMDVAAHGFETKVRVE